MSTPWSTTSSTGKCSFGGVVVWLVVMARTRTRSLSPPPLYTLPLFHPFPLLALNIITHTHKTTTNRSQITYNTAPTFEVTVRNNYLKGSVPTWLLAAPLFSLDLGLVRVCACVAVCGCVSVGCVRGCQHRRRRRRRRRGTYTPRRSHKHRYRYPPSPRATNNNNAPPPPFSELPLGQLAGLPG